jgi:hypothetical protein
MNISFAVKVQMAGLDRFHNMLAAAGRQAPAAIRRAINHTGAKTRTAMKKSLTAQTGLKAGTIDKALKATKAADGGLNGFVAGKGSLEYVVRSRGGDISLKYFRPQEKGAGVIAKPWGRDTFFKGAFRKSTYVKQGKKKLLYKRLINAKFHGHAMINVEGGKWGGKMKAMKSGVVIPEEMITGATEAAFFQTSGELAKRLEHELMRILGD